MGYEVISSGGSTSAIKCASQLAEEEADIGLFNLAVKG